MNLLEDLRTGLRSLAGAPLFTAMAVLTLAIGIGSNTFIYSGVKSYLFDFLPYPESDRVQSLWMRNVEVGFTTSVSLPDYLDWRERNECFSELALFTWSGFNLFDGDRGVRVSGSKVSANLFDALGVPPALGRTFADGEDQVGAPNVAVVSHRLWRDQLEGTSDLKDEEIVLDGETYAVVGVMPESFFYPSTEQVLWIPHRMDPIEYGRGSRFLRAVGRLRPGVSEAQAAAELEALAADLAREHPDTNAGYTIAMVPTAEDLIDEEMRLSIYSLWGAVFFVLLIACANVANLMLTRATARQREFAIRAAVGARPRHLVRQLMTESLLVSLAGGGLGLLAALWGIDLVVAATPPDVWYMDILYVDWSFVTFTLGVCVATTFLFGLAPSLQASRVDLVSVLKDGGAAGTGRSKLRLRKVLTVVQVSLALMLLVGAGLMVRSLRGLLSSSPGFAIDTTLAGRVLLPKADYPTAEDRLGFFELWRERTRELPGVASTALVQRLPLSGGNSSNSLQIEGWGPADPSDEPWSNLQVASHDYFETMQIPLVAGRGLTSVDDASSRKVAVVNQHLASLYWPDDDPLGKRFRIGEAADWWTVVGVSRDIHQNGVSFSIRPELVMPLEQVSTPTQMSLVVRAERDPETLLQPVLAEAWDLDPQLGVADLMTMSTRRRSRMWGIDLTSRMFGLFGLLALFLALIGVYGVMSYSVAHRTHEIGVRVSLGAGPRDVVGLVLRQAVRLALIGLVIGTVGALALTRVLESLLFEVSPTDPLVFTSVALILFLTTLAASAFPALRAARLHPMEALRSE